MKKIIIKKTIILGAFFLLCCAFLFGCGNVKTDAEQSPNLMNASVTSYNEGSESKQYVKVLLEFDKDISISEKLDDSLRITIAGERVQPDEYVLTQGDDASQAELLISVNAITKGVLEIERSEKAKTISDIMDVSGKFAVNDFQIEGLIPSGVTLSDVASDETSVTKQVDSVWNIRSIAWVCLTKNGKVIPVNETDTNEELDGYVAVHGHEFLIEDEGTIAEKIVEALDRVYGDEYQFSSDKNRVTANVLNGDAGEYDIQIYQYLKINGEDVSTAEETHSDDAEHELGSKVKTSVVDREPTAQEQEFLNKLHISQISEEQIKDGSDVYSVLTITGDAMPEEEIYSVRDLEELIKLSFTNQKMSELSLASEETVALAGTSEATYYGIDFVKFLELCGVDITQSDLCMTLESADGNSQRIMLGKLISGNAKLELVFADASGPLTTETENIQGPIGYLCLADGSEEIPSFGNVKKIIVDKSENAAAVEYKFHNRDPYLDSLDLTFTVEVYKRGSEYLGAVTTKTFTTEQLEQLMKEYPEHVIGNYYGTIGNAEEFQYIGVGGWLDYFEGLDLRWLLKDQVGVESFTGSAELIGRDGEIYGTIDDLSYFSAVDDEDYYVLSADGIRIPNAVPMIACTKNGYPILPEHDHESSGYIAYNHMNDQLQSMGIETEVGVVKNHNGPFIACLGNAENLYGGNQIETGGDCVLMKIYTD